MKYILSAVIFFLFAPFNANAYVVKRGDSLASIARANYGEPVFGPTGTINKIYSLNPWAKTNPALSPGQTVVLEERLGEKTASAPAPAADAKSADIPIEKFAETAQTSTEAPTPRAPLSPQIAIAPIRTTASVSEPAGVEAKKEEKTASPAVEAKSSETIDEEESAEKNIFAAIASYTQISKIATDVETNTGYSLNSSPAYGLELSWNHHWAPGFSTLASYSFTQLSSNETSDLTGSKVINNMTLNKAELALLNRVTPWLRFGLGVAYGDHIFLENFVDVPRDPSVYKTAFLNPYFMAEWTMFESKKFEGNLEVKADALPAQVGSGHDLTAGYGFSVQASLLEKFYHWSLFYGVRYETENQTRTDANETSSRWDFRIGALF